MQGLFLFYKSTVGKKIVMAVMGLVLLLFVLGHMAGNLKMFMGFDAVRHIYFVDHYAELLRTIGEDFLGHRTVLWMVRIVLVVCALLHIVLSLQLSWLNRKARPLGYMNQDYQSANLASRTMLYGGLFLGLFIVFHILHFTTGELHSYGFEPGKVYSNVYSAFIHGPLVLVYLAAMLFIALHLYHGAWSLFQTLGVDTPSLNRPLRIIAALLSVGLFIGFSVVPVCVYFGVVSAPMQV